jgi:hypothetical protein
MEVNWTKENAGVAAVTQKAGWKVTCTVPAAADSAEVKTMAVLDYREKQANQTRP